MPRRIASVVLLVLMLAAGRITRAADGVVGDGTAGSCTFAELQSEVVAGGSISFNCGANPLTITVTSTLDITAATTTLDGGNFITLSGANARRIFTVTTLGNNAITLTLRNLTLTNGRASGTNENANGAAIMIRNQSISLASPPTLNIEDVTFTGNISNLTSFSGAGINAYDFGGGGIYAIGGTVNVTDSAFTDNNANNAAGGAIHILRSNLSIQNSTFTGNSAIGSIPANSVGGAIYMDGLRETGGSFTISGSRFEDNTAYNSGGAIHVNLYENASPFTVDQSSFINNRVTGGTRGQGGAIGGGGTDIGGATGNPSITITNSLFSGNSARSTGSPGDGSGGALSFPQKAVIMIANSTFTGNIAYGTSYNANGGAIYITGNTTVFQIINSTIADNHAGWVGGGVVNSALPSTTTPGGIIRNTIFSNNTADNGTNTWDIQQQCGAIVTNPGVSVIPPLTNGGNNFQYPNRNPSPNYWNETVCASSITIADAKLQPLTDNGGPSQTRALASDSPAIDAGSNTVCAAAPISNLDQRGQSRPVDGNGDASAVCDSGAFEFVSNQPPFAPTLIAPTNNAVLSTNALTFTWNHGAFAEEYRLQVDDDPGFGSPSIDETQTATSFPVGYLAVGTYSWRVQSINPYGTAYSSVQTFTIISAQNAAPIHTLYTTLTPTLTWSAVDWAVGYWVQVDDSPTFNAPVLFQNTNVPADQLSITAILSADGVYYWRVCARPTPSECRGWSAVDSFVIDAP